MLQRSAELARLVEAHRSERVVVCGMGGSSLAPLVLGRAYGAPLEVLDTTHPAALRRLEVDGALFVISSKSGLDRGDALPLRPPLGPHRQARPAPSSSSPTPARRSSSSRRSAASRPSPESRRSAGATRRCRCSGSSPRRWPASTSPGCSRAPRRCTTPAGSPTGIPASSSASRWGRAGRRGATRSSSRIPGGFGLWLEQLIAESTGKDGRGLVPAAGESVGRRRPAARGDRHLCTGRPRCGVLPLRAGDGGRRRDPRRQPLRPAERRGGKGQDAGHPRFRTCPRDSPW